ncbi:hypothetical protein MASSI9I_90616 [Massilia sp. 9I]|nr:hypothetical protein MASSI9I_90616 [Massilia sp. 9I]
MTVFRFVLSGAGNSAQPSNQNDVIPAQAGIQFCLHRANSSSIDKRHLVALWQLQSLSNQHPRPTPPHFRVKLPIRRSHRAPARPCPETCS